MNIDTNTIIKTSAIYAALAVLLGGLWTAGEATGYRPWLKKEMQEFTQRDFQQVMEQSQQNTQSVLALEFWRLDDKRKLGNLDDENFQKYCQIAQLLKYFKAPGCIFNPEVVVPTQPAVGG